VPAERSTAAARTASFGDFVAGRASAGRLIVQPRMGFGKPAVMRAGLRAVRDAAADTVGTITLDSYTRVGAHGRAADALAHGHELNGYPLVTHAASTTRDVLDGIAAPDFPVQVRHGSALPSAIVAAAVRAGITATEGGPVSYCLPYSRVPLAEAAEDWARACDFLAEAPNAHLESFGGCLLGQLCPPALLVAVSVLECLFARQHGVRDVSCSYAQQTNHEQDVEAISALRQLADEFLGDTDWHVVVYTYMGMFPVTVRGARMILAESVRLAVDTGSERLIVKTSAEAHRIPTIAENVRALEDAHTDAIRFAQTSCPVPDSENVRRTEVYQQARTLIEMVLSISADLGVGFVTAFSRGYLDVPYCLHPDNRNRSRSFLDRDGRLRWSAVGGMPLTVSSAARRASEGVSPSVELLAMLRWTRERFDNSDASAV
jgi:methylaspartate mutase epsilon subunit